MESLKSALASIGRMWAQLTATQRVILSAAALAMGLVLVWGSAGSTQAWARVAGPEADVSSRQSILRYLQDHGQRYEVRGSEILVPKQDADRVILELAGEGAMSDKAIYDFIGVNDPLMDRRSKDLQFKHALELKLGSLIRKMDSVRNASVLITPGTESDRMTVGGTRAKASVQIELPQGRTLSSKNVTAIARIVAHAVQGLDEDQVVICDNWLNSYSLPPSEGGGASAILDIREHEKAVEDELQNRIKKALPPSAHVAVKVSARSTSTVKDTRKFSNYKPLHEEERRVTERGGSAAPTKGIKGEADAPAAGQETPTRTESETKTDYKQDQEDTHTIELPGKIEKISVAVLIPIEVGPDQKESAEQVREIAKYKAFVEAAIGLDAVEKKVVVESLPTRRPEPLAQAAESESALEWVSLHAAKIGLFALGLFGLAILGLVLRGALAKDTVEELQALTTALREEPAGELALPAEGDVARLKRGLEEMVGRSPKAVAASLKSFMSGR